MNLIKSRNPTPTVYSIHQFMNFENHNNRFKNKALKYFLQVKKIFNIVIKISALAISDEVIYTLKKY